jgi:hypothetical protein|tara:strand:- start:444 stop:554 length:111 start_codon:yes stop_codon:yes gene_type:complete
MDAEELWDFLSDALTELVDAGIVSLEEAILVLGIEE